MWHGAGWTYIVWGSLHGMYVVLYHSWINFREKFELSLAKRTRCKKVGACLLTFLCVTISWVIFRAETLDAAKVILLGMSGYNGISISGIRGDELIHVGSSLGFSEARFSGGKGLPIELHILAQIIFFLLVVFLAPNTQQIIKKYDPAIRYGLTGEASNAIQWKSIITWTILTGLLAGISMGVILLSGEPSPFLYYSF